MCCVHVGQADFRTQDTERPPLAALLGKFLFGKKALVRWGSPSLDCVLSRCTGHSVGLQKRGHLLCGGAAILS